MQQILLSSSIELRVESGEMTGLVRTMSRTLNFSISLSCVNFV